MRYTGPRNRLSRREGLDLGLKTPGSKSHASLLKKLNIFPGQHGTKGRRKVSEHGKQLREKQKLRFMYGLSEKQLKNYFNKAISRTGNTGLYLTQYLEKRLDTVIFRLGFAPTQSAARQLVSHKHVKVNNKIVNIPSYQMKIGDVITFSKEASTKIPAVEQVMSRKDIIMPGWVERKSSVGSLIQDPTSDLLEKQINVRLVIEFYSR